MDLFDKAIGQPRNLLPKDGIVHYYGPFMSLQRADDHLDSLLTDIAWENDEAIIMGKRILTKRKVAWHADSSFEYTYSGITKRALILQHGSVLVMKGTTQTHWLHCLPPTKTVDRPRINLTFRTIVGKK